MKYRAGSKHSNTQPTGGINIEYYVQLAIGVLLLRPCLH